jgi:hypothetical protein
MHHFHLHRFFDGIPPALGIPAGVLIWLFVSGCFYLILTKANKRPGCLVWVPILQFIPVMDAADMSLLWLLILLIPGLGALIFWVVLGIGLSKARGKDLLWGVLFAIPCTSPFALVYLAIA